MVEVITPMHAVIYVRPGRLARRHQSECAAWCARHGHRVAGVTSSPAAAMGLLAAGADVVIVARDAHGHDLPDAPVVRIPRTSGLQLAWAAVAAAAGWLAGRAREHRAAAAGVAAAGAAATLASVPLLVPRPVPPAAGGPVLTAPPALAPASPAGPATTSARPATATTVPAGPPATTSTSAAGDGPVPAPGDLMPTLPPTAPAGPPRQQLQPPSVPRLPTAPARCRCGDRDEDEDRCDGDGDEDGHRVPSVRPPAPRLPVCPSRYEEDDEDRPDG